jgi:phosphoesterase RecJ-like protein
MKEVADKFIQLLESAERILVITHVGPDPDAFTSLLLMGTTLKKNYPDKQIMMTSEEQTGDLSSLTGYQDIKLQRLEEAIDQYAPQLIIMVDSMNFKRCTRKDADVISKKVKDQGIKLVIIDHHERTDVEDNAVYINNDGPAAVQEVYETLFRDMGLQKPEGYAQTTMLGLYSDSGGFINHNPRFDDTMDLAKELTAAGANLELINNLLSRHSFDEMSAIGELASNLGFNDDYNFSFISDEFTKRWEDDGKDFEELKLGVSAFVNHYIRNIGERRWGFVVYKDLAAGDNIYGVSLRSISGTKNVAEIANRLGGGGHIPAAGAKIQVNSVKDALEQVKKVIVAG